MEEMKIATDLFNPTEILVIDTETTGLRPWKGDRPFAVSACDQDGNTWYCQWPVDLETREVCPDLDDVFLLQHLAKDPNTKKVFFNSKFDIRMLEKFDIHFAGEIHDVYYMARVCNTEEEAYGLKPLARKYLGYPDDDEKELRSAVSKAKRFLKKNKIPFNEGDDLAANYFLPEQVLGEKLCERYAIGDVVRTLLLYIFYMEIMEETPCYKSTYDKEMLLQRVVVKMENRGVRIDLEETRRELERYDRHSEECIKRMLEFVGDPEFNPGSPKQIQEVLYSFGYGIELEPTKYTAKGSPSTDLEVLSEHTHIPFVRDLLEWKGNKKGAEFMNKYLFLAVPDTISPDTYVLHTSLNQGGARTGRFSSSEPNIQNAANAASSGKGGLVLINARKPFGPRPGYIWVCMDYANQEGRIFADLADISAMIQALNEGLDFNTFVANSVWGGNTQRAILNAQASLELANPYPSGANADALLKARRRLGWEIKDAVAFYERSSRARDAAASWLWEHHYDIVKAEKSIGINRTRTRAKFLIFNKIYGGGAAVAAGIIKCDIDEAREFLQHLETTFPGIQRYINHISKLGIRQGYIETRYGRRINVDPQYAYRASNYSVQGTAADMMKDALLRCDEFLVGSGLDAHLIMTIHDEIVFEIRKEHASKKLLKRLKLIMEDTGGRIRVPMEVEAKIVRHSWQDKEELEL